MFDIGFWELTLVGVIALLVIGPEKLPGVARTAGVWVAKVRRMAASVRADIDRELQATELKQLLTQQQEEMKELRQIIDETRSTVETDLERIASEHAGAASSVKNHASEDTAQTAAPLPKPTPSAPSLSADRHTLPYDESK